MCVRVHSGVPIVQGGYNRVVGHYVLLTLHPSRSGTLLLLVSGTTPLSNKRRKAIVHKIIKGAGRVNHVMGDGVLTTANLVLWPWGDGTASDSCFPAARLPQ